MPPAGSASAAAAQGAGEGTAGRKASNVVGTTRVIRVSPLNRRIAVLIKLVSGRSDLALAWVQLQQLRQWKWREGVALLFTAADLDGWCQELSTDLIVLRCRTDPSAALCGTVREFLVESLLAEKVRNLSALGLVVPSGFVVDAFLRMLCYRRTRSSDKEPRA